MVYRDTTNFRSSIEQVAPQEGIPQQDTLVQTLAGMGQQIIAENQKAKINENFSKAQLDIAALDREYQTKFEGQPFAGLEELKQKRDEIVSSYGDQISPFFKRDWQDNARQLTINHDASTEAWAYGQTKKNTVSSINSTIKTNLGQAMIDGQGFGKNQQGEIGSAINYADSRNNLYAFGTEFLGEQTTSELLESYSSDYIKSFISGVTETNPDKALMLLENEDIKGQIGPQDHSELTKLIGKIKKANAVQAKKAHVDSAIDVTDFVNDTSKTYYEKRLSVDQMELEGKLKPSTAAQARRVLSSQKDVDSVTDTKEMSDIIQSVYDLNSIQDINNEDYLDGMSNIHDRILQKQAEGVINSSDVQKLNGEIKTLTSKRVADATTAVGKTFSDANEKFNTLPPEYRGEATRKLFYATRGKQDELGDDGYKEFSSNAANSIVDEINKGRREKTIKKINEITKPTVEKKETNDSDLEGFIKSKGYSMKDVQETAKIYGITEQEVIDRLRAKK